MEMKLALDGFKELVERNHREIDAMRAEKGLPPFDWSPEARLEKRKAWIAASHLVRSAAQTIRAKRVAKARAAAR